MTRCGAFDGGAITPDAGALLLGATDRAIGLVGRLAAYFPDDRHPGLIEHKVATLVGQRLFGLTLGYEDLVDHDTFRHDLVLAVLAGKLTARRSDCAPLAGKSTLNRLDHAPATPTRYRRISHDAGAIVRLVVDLFIEAHHMPPRQITLNLDATDDQLHGHQEGRFFHGYYDSYCYLPLYVFYGRRLPLYNCRWSHSSLDRQTPDHAYFTPLPQTVAACIRRISTYPAASCCKNNRGDLCSAWMRNGGHVGQPRRSGRLRSTASQPCAKWTSDPKRNCGQFEIRASALTRSEDSHGG